MIETVRQVYLLDPSIGEYVVVGRLERIAEPAKESEMGSAAKAPDACLISRLFGK